MAVNRLLQVGDRLGIRLGLHDQSFAAAICGSVRPICLSKLSIAAVFDFGFAISLSTLSISPGVRLIRVSSASILLVSDLAS